MKLTNDEMDTLIAKYVDALVELRVIGKKILDGSTYEQWEQYKELREIDCLDDQFSISIDYFDRC